MSRASVPYADLRGSDLIVDRIYEGGTYKDRRDDAIGPLLPGVGNQAGFRPAGSPTKDTVRLVALFSTGEEPDWPDFLDVYTGDFVYYGDNKSPGHELHETVRRGNLLMRRVFNRSHADEAARRTIPPFFLFDKPGKGPAVRFRGLLAPGSPRLTDEEELVAVWRTKKNERFQNYRAHFTVLDVPVVTRAWINQILSGDPLGSECPEAWRAWCQSRAYQPLEAPRTLTVRTREQQLPRGKDLSLLIAIYSHFKEEPTEFEAFAAEIFKMAEPRVDRIDVTRPWRDGGRDAVGDLIIGPNNDPVAVEFALEAKCYDPQRRGGVGIRGTSRLISRLRHRQFGVIVTTSFVEGQAYSEIRGDGHPVVIISGLDVVEVLKKRGYDSLPTLKLLLERSYPLSGR